MRSRISSWNETVTKLGFKRKKRKVRGNTGFARPLRVEGLEDRRMLATYTVDSLTDDGVGVTLRDAIDSANANPDHDTIVFSSAITGDNQTITLTQGDLNIFYDLTISGPGKGLGNTSLYDLTISGNNASRIFDVMGSVSLVEISGLKLTGGNAQDITDPENRNGGAIRSLGASMTINNVEVSGNQAGYGGGGLDIKTTGGEFNPQNVTIRNSVITGNQSGLAGSGNGGGINLATGTHDTILIEDSTISYNTAYGTAAPGNIPSVSTGGGISINNNASFILSRSTVSNNTAYGSGGGIHLVNSKQATIENTTISSNRSLSEGGGIHVLDVEASTRIVHSTIVFNEVGFTDGNPYEVSAHLVTGGGLFVVGGPDNVSRTILDHTIVSDNEDLIDLSPDLEGADATTPDIFIYTGDSHIGLYIPPQSINADYSLIGDVKSGNNVISSSHPDGIVDGFAIGSGVKFGQPGVGPLANNGGPTLTHLPLPGSLAIDGGNSGISDPPAADQRGFDRIFDGDGNGSEIIDIGAVEFGSDPILDADFDDDGFVNGNDLLIWQRGLGIMSGAVNSQGDANGDGKVDALDLAVWKLKFGDSAVPTILNADADNNGTVNLTDYIITTQNLGMASATFADGDANGDGNVNGLDILAWELDDKSRFGYIFVRGSQCSGGVATWANSRLYSRR